MEILTLEGKLSHVTRRTEGPKDVETDIKILNVPFRNFAKALKIMLKYRLITLGSLSLTVGRIRPVFLLQFYKPESTNQQSVSTGYVSTI